MVSIVMITMHSDNGKFLWRRFTKPRFALPCPEKMHEPDLKHRMR